MKSKILILLGVLALIAVGLFIFPFVIESTPPKTLPPLQGSSTGPQLASHLEMPEQPTEKAAQTSKSSPTPLQAPSSIHALLLNPKKLLTADQGWRHVQIRGYSTASLLAALRASGNLDFLREAERRYPDNPDVMLEIAMRSQNPDERLGALETMIKQDPESGLASYLYASEKLKAGDTGAAIQALLEADSKTWVDIPMDSVMQGLEQAYLDAGYSLAQAKVLSTYQAPMPYMSEFQKLTSKIDELAKQSPDAIGGVSADSLNSVGISLAQKMAKERITLLEELVAMSIESKFLKNLSPQTITKSGQTVQQRLSEIEADRAEIKSLTTNAGKILANLNEQDAVTYFETFGKYGEREALKRAQAKWSAHSAP